MKIIHDDEVLNAFCAPGGYIYVYSGLMRYLDSEDHLAGVLGHEIAHAELRHSSLRLQKEYGTQKLLDFALLATPVSLGQAVNASILQELVNLDYSRDQEAQADEYSVRYLAGSGYACDGAAGFFIKLLEETIHVLTDDKACLKRKLRIGQTHSFASDRQCHSSQFK